ncbi:MAG: tetratricopeptide repeat protein [Bacteroidota bacterium]
MSQKTEQLFERAKANLKKDNHENALRLLNEVLNREPAHKQALRNKALIKAENEAPEQAEQFLLFAIDQQPEDDQLYQILGTLYHNNGKPQKALAQFKKAININGDNVLAQQGCAVVHAQFLGEHNRAITHFSKALEHAPENADLYFNRGCSYMITKQMSKAEKDLQKAANLGHPKAKEMTEKYFE